MQDLHEGVLLEFCERSLSTASIGKWSVGLHITNSLFSGDDKHRTLPESNKKKPSGGHAARAARRASVRTGHACKVCCKEIAGAWAVCRGKARVTCGPDCQNEYVKSYGREWARKARMAKAR